MDLSWDLCRRQLPTATWPVDVQSLWPTEVLDAQLSDSLVCRPALASRLDFEADVVHVVVVAVAVGHYHHVAVVLVLSGGDHVADYNSAFVFVSLLFV